MKYAAIAQSAVSFSISRLCRVLGVSRSGYYDWLRREPSARARQDALLTEQIQSIAAEFRYTYGVPRVYAELRDRGVRVSRKRVSRLMRVAQIKVLGAKAFKPRTTISDPKNPIAPNLLQRQFRQVTAPHQVWTSDITYIPTREGFLYVAGIEDLFSRQIVGIAMDAHMRTELVERAFQMAWQQQKPASGLIHHSDRGCQYTSHDYLNRLTELGVRISMSGKGQCLDNAPIESFWSTLKRECAYFVFASHAQARAMIFEYVMVFYNQQRRHSALGYLSPQQFQQQTTGQILCA